MKPPSQPLVSEPLFSPWGAERDNTVFADPLMDGAASTALNGVRLSGRGEWTGYLIRRSPGYEIGGLTLITPATVGDCYQSTFQVPRDAAAIFHTHMKFSRDVRGYAAMNRVGDVPGPRDHWTLYGRTPRPNYFRGPGGGISAIERQGYSPEIFTPRRIN